MLTSIPGRDNHRAETNPLFGGLKSLPREYMKLWFVCSYYLANFLLEFDLQPKKHRGLVILSIVPSIPSRAALAVPPALSRLTAYL